MKEPLLDMCFRHEQFVWHFFLDDNNRLCWKNSPREKKQWSEPAVLQNSYGGQFVVALGSREQIHLAASDVENTIWYHCFAEGIWSSSMVAEVPPLVEINDLSLTVDSTKRVHLLYCLRSGSQNGEWQITHGLWTGKSWNSCILDSGKGMAEAKTAAAIDGNDNLHAVYSAPSRNSTLLLHQVYDNDAGEWKTQEQIPLLHQENQQPCAVFDKGGNLHLVWICSDGRNFRTAYSRWKNSPWPEGGWDEPKYISDKGVNAYSPYILITGDSITALWQQLNGVLYRISGDLGQTWGNVEKQTAVKNLDNYVLNHFSPGDGETAHLNAFSSSGPQVTLAAAASLLKAVDGEHNLRAASPVPVKETRAAANIQDEQVSSTVRKFLLEYSDTRLTNKLMNQTIENQEQNISRLEEQKQSLRAKLKQQFREVKTLKALSEMYRKETETLTQSMHRLNERINELESAIGALNEEKKLLETSLAALESRKAGLKENLQEALNDNSTLQDKILNLANEKNKLELELKQCLMRESEGEKMLQQYLDENTLLKAQIHKYQQQLAQLEDANTLLSSQEDTDRTSGKAKHIPYLMLTSEDVG